MLEKIDFQQMIDKAPLPAQGSNRGYDPKQLILNFLGFLEDTLARLAGKRVGLLRADGGFYSKEIFEYLETGHSSPIDHIIAARFYVPIKRALAYHRRWWKLDDGIEIAETHYQAEDWQRARRMIMVLKALIPGNSGQLKPH